MTEQWHLLPIGEIEKKLNTNAASGLTRKAARKKTNPDSLEARSLFITPRQPAWKCLLQAFRDPFLIMLAVVAIIAMIFSRVDLGIAIMITVMINSIISGLSYLKAQRIRESMQMYSNPLVKVIREGRLYTTESRNVRAGDLIFLSAGDIVPGDSRLIESDGLTVMQFKKENEKLISYKCEKNASTLYTDKVVYPPDVDNMVFGGSAVTDGFAKALVCSTGGATYMGALTGGVAPATGPSDPNGLKLLKNYCKYYNLLMSILIIPLCILGIFRLKSSELVDVFLIPLSLAASSLSENMLAAGRIISAVKLSELALKEQNDNVIVKNTPAQDKLCKMTDLFAFGRCILTDGVYKIDTVYTCGKEYADDSFVNNNVFRLAEFLYEFSLAKLRMPSDIRSDDLYLNRYYHSIAELIRTAGVDTDEYDLKITSAAVRVSEDGKTECALSELADGSEERVYLSRTSDMIDKCNMVRTELGLLAMTDVQREKIRKQYVSDLTLGGVPMLISSYDGNNVIYEGMLIMRERADKSAWKAAKEFNDLNVGLSFFLDEEGYENNYYLRETGLCGSADDIINASSVKAAGKSLADVFGKHRAYIGFREDEIISLIKDLRKEGRVIGAALVENKYNPIIESCDLSVSFDSIKYHSEKVADAVWEYMPADGREYSPRCSQLTRRLADILVSRTDGRHGGIGSIVKALYSAKEFYRDLSDMVGCLVTSQAMRLTLVIFPMLIGNYCLTAPEILLSGLLIDFLTVIVFAFARPSRLTLKYQEPIPKRLINPLIGSPEELITGASSALAVLIAAILSCIGGRSGGNAYIFISLILIQLTSVFASLRSQFDKRSENGRRFSPGLPFFILTAFSAVVSILLILHPTLSVAVGCSGFRWIHAALLPIGPAVYLIIRKISADFFRIRKEK